MQLYFSIGRVKIELHGLGAPDLSMKSLSPEDQLKLTAAQHELAFGNPSIALGMAKKLAASAAQSPDAQQFLGICLAEAGNNTQAKAAFHQALTLAPGHPLILVNLAKLYSQTGETEAAVSSLRKAVSSDPGFSQAWLALGRQLLRGNRPQEAIKAFEHLTRLAPEHAIGWMQLAKAKRSCGDFEGAESALVKSLSLASSNAQAWLNLGAIRRLLGRPGQALQCYSKAAELGYRAPDLADARIGALLDLGQTASALTEAKQLVDQHPQFADGQRTLAHLLWEHGPALAPSEDPLARFGEAVEKLGDRDLRLAYAQFLLSAREPKAALRQIETLRAEAEHPMLMAMAGDSHELLGDTETAAGLYEVAKRDLGENPAFLCTFARHLLKRGDWQRARDTASHAVAIAPFNQEAWAYLGTAWRLLDDAREFWLCDYDRLICFLEVAAPPGFNDLDEFAAALRNTLEPMHQARREPVQQSVRGGSQTSGRLFGRDNAVLHSLQHSLTRTIQTWLKSLEQRDEHPFYRRVAPNIRYTGSWSVKLWSSGNHANHIHPEGWISSAYYVALPPSVLAAQTDALSHSGAIQFGQPPAELGLNLKPRRIIRPKIGHLALFPSYMWHGTVPFSDDHARITVAFDLNPVKLS